jgi:hypothetical protein
MCLSLIRELGLTCFIKKLYGLALHVGKFKQIAIPTGSVPGVVIIGESLCLGWLPIFGRFLLRVFR